MKKLLSILFLLKFVSAYPTPIILWHGMGKNSFFFNLQYYYFVLLRFFLVGDTCCVDFSLGYFKLFLERQIPGVYVNSLRIGNSTIDDFDNGYFMHPNKQIEYVCKLLATDPKLANGFNAIGFSQGAQFL